MKDFKPLDFTPEPARGTWLKRGDLSEAYACEAKIDGARQVLTNNGVITMTGRRTSTKTGQKLDKIGHVPHLEVYMSELRGWVLDGELYVPGGQSNEVVSIIGSRQEKALVKQKERGNLCFMVFDVLFAQGTDMRGFTYERRRRTLEELFDPRSRLQQTQKHVHLVPHFEPDANACSDGADYIQQAFEMATQDGYEGLIVKRLNGTYNHREWCKMKAENTYDMVIMGYDESDSDTFRGNGIAALQLGLYTSTGALQEVTKCSGMTHHWRRTFYADGRDSGDYYGQVVEVQAQEMFETGALRHPRFVKLRPDANANDQTYTKYNLKE